MNSLKNNKVVRVEHILEEDCSTERPFKCSLCDYSSLQRSCLKYHMRTHTGERPFACTKCNYSAALRSTLNSHIKNVHYEGEHKCKLCDFSSLERKNLHLHMRTHIIEPSLQRWRSHKQNPTQEETVQVSSKQHGYEHQPPQDDLDQIPPSHEEAPMQVTSTAPDLQPSTSEPIPESNVSFEAILLKTFNKRNSENLIRKPKRKVCNGAEVVTSKDVLQRLEQLDKMKNKSKPKKPPVVEEITSDEEDENEVIN
ncbi:hypothetical protein RN001_003833 [Aquatica leii]|uniref:C2H2-type domain-containing protein n=1 Tax=Aquatica leii TaxID=1421715 RepID=A0AAN7PIW5_9COLE|nr:hypothetical protein RN001_003833 [Aquatica leii]